MKATVKPRCAALALAVLTVSALPLPRASATPSEGNAARIVIIKPKDGMQSDFEAGYKRHLEWHRKNDDPWVWYGWQILTGTHARQFMDGTFGHEWTDFDNAVNPPGDMADNTANVLPYGDFVSASHFVLLDAYSRGRLLEERNPSRFISLRHYSIQPGSEVAFEKILEKGRDVYERVDPSRRYSWYKLVEGGEQPMYILMLPVDKLSDFEQMESSWMEVVSRNAKLEDKIAQAVRGVRSELLRYRPDMSYMPEETSAAPSP